MCFHINMYIYNKYIWYILYIYIYIMFFSVVEGVHGPPGPRQRFLTQRARPWLHPRVLGTPGCARCTRHRRERIQQTKWEGLQGHRVEGHFWKTCFLRFGLFLFVFSAIFGKVCWFFRSFFGLEIEVKGLGTDVVDSSDLVQFWADINASEEFCTCSGLIDWLPSLPGFSRCRKKHVYI